MSENLKNHFRSAVDGAIGGVNMGLGMGLMMSAGWSTGPLVGGIMGIAALNIFLSNQFIRPALNLEKKNRKLGSDLAGFVAGYLLAGGLALGMEHLKTKDSGPVTNPNHTETVSQQQVLPKPALLVLS